MAKPTKPHSPAKTRKSSEAGIVGGTIHTLYGSLTSAQPDGAGDPSRTIQSKASVDDRTTRTGVAVGKDGNAKPDKGVLR